MSALLYCVLGPLCVLKNDHWRSISQPKPAAVLGCLLLHANTSIPAQRLVHEVWGEQPPRRAEASLQAYISRLRQILPTDASGASVLRTSAAGYMMAVKPGELDSQVFSDLVFHGRTAAQTQEDIRAEDALVKAMHLWNGPVLGAVGDGPMTTSMREVLSEARIECIELRAEVGLRLGQHRELISTLRHVTMERPLHEGFWALLMQALWQSSRRADALAAFRTARDVLNRELGLEPGPTLQHLQSAILQETG